MCAVMVLEIVIQLSAQFDTFETQMWLFTIIFVMFVSIVHIVVIISSKGKKRVVTSLYLGLDALLKLFIPCEKFDTNVTDIIRKNHLCYKSIKFCL